MHDASSARIDLSEKLGADVGVCQVPLFLAIVVFSPRSEEWGQACRRFSFGGLLDIGLSSGGD